MITTRVLWLLALALLICQLWVAADDEEGDGETPLQYEIDAERSWLRVLVYRGGLLRGLGHNHVVAHRNLSGTVKSNDVSGLAQLSLQLAVADFEIDNASDRVAEGDDFPGEIPAKDIAGTRKNMLGRKLLDEENHPSIVIESDSSAGEIPSVDVNARITIRGQTHQLIVPVTVELLEDAIVASGELSMTHGDIGLKPFKAALGALRVRDDLIIKFEIAAVRTDLMQSQDVSQPLSAH